LISGKLDGPYVLNWL